MSGEVREQTDLATWLLACVAEDTLRLLALPYRDRPGYVEDWSPDGR